jgi:hypothetical protein
MRTDPRLNEGLILGIPGDEVRVKVILGYDRLNLSLKLLLPLKGQESLRISGERFNISVTLLSRRAKEDRRKETIALKLSENRRYWKVRV